MQTTLNKPTGPKLLNLH